MNKSIKFLACIFAVSALAVACNNAPENTEDTTAVDTPEVIIDTLVVDTPAVDTVVVEETPAPAKKTTTVKKRTDVTKKANAERQTEGLKEVDVAKKGSNALQDDKLKNSDNKGATKDRSGFGTK